MVQYPWYGRVQEWLNWTVSKTVEAFFVSEGSNPSPSAKLKIDLCGLFLVWL
jgi:hypothetical protein